ncbi:MAG: sugar ABC transporter permease [Proteobacteria bacterium]|jgi:multiple sugar transport system permease protein|nr:sugar ABC transporter permease [Pseudomonadota bacterium]MDA1034758.1 sugar ABC transporter permease [Pseudomonadota bacterium]MDA8711460.1 sugar ABC transporter permease [Alphaproteobacteria bacterium]MDB0034277.1 sugar ABC transporter permease [Alphaproteobacteria bacterium]MDB2371755.1 sugar ABC transporter permease [Alphaproteobacteria bacterium]
MKINRKLFPYVLTLPALLVCVGILIPFFTAVYYSLQRYNLKMPHMKGFIWFDNYVSIFTDPSFWNTIKVSLTYTFFTIIIELLLGLGIALLLAKRNWLNNILGVLLVLPLMIAPALASLIWRLLINPNFGVVNYLLSFIGLDDFTWASHPDTVLFTLIMVDVWVFTPFIMILLLAGLRSLPRQPFEAAELDGVPEYYKFFRITLPMLFPFILTASLFRLLESIQQFDIIYALSQGGPGESSMVFQVSAYLQTFQYTNIGKAAAMMVVLWAICYFLCHVFVKQWHKLKIKTKGELLQ